MGQKDLELLVGKLRSMHLAVPGTVAHLYHIQRDLAQGGGGGGPGLAVARISSMDSGLVGPSSADGSLAYAPGRDLPSQTHPSGVMQRFGPRGRGHVA